MSEHTSVEETITSHLSAGPDRIVSFDIFDTLLLRRCEPELARLFSVSRWQARALRKAGMDASAQTVYRARAVYQKRAYDDVRDGTGPEPCYADIADPMIRDLGLPHGSRRHLLEAETDWDLAHVRANAGLLSALAAALKMAPPPAAVIGVSDMYFPKASIRRLIQTHVPELGDIRLFVSSDERASKRRGDLFPRVAQALGVAASTILHIGDCPHADGRQAEAAGCRSFLLRRNRVCRTVSAMQDHAIRWGLRRWPAREVAPAT